jgi:prepilin-type N-terminal cleavage/methylation domain-containing protein
MSRRRGFTLMELMVVMIIIGILLGFILMASMNAVRTAQENATRALISKLDSGMTDRIDALLTQRIEPTLFHFATAYSWAQGRSWQQNNFSISTDRDAFQRAGVIARYDQLKAELPDAFIVQNGKNYALNYGMIPFSGLGEPIVDYQCVSPIGVGSSLSTPVNVGTGIYGATYTMHAAINRNLGKWTDAVTAAVGNGVGVKGFDMVDDNGNNLIDDYGEWGGDSDGSIAKALSNHTHITARAEMLYALLVEGQGPYGSVFNRDDFTDKEVADTDRDGLPEFIDGWGNPLQFYRWPILYHSDLQRGLYLVQNGSNDSNGNAAYVPSPPYGNAFDTREQDPLDPNQELTMPDWWCASINASYPYSASSGPLSGGGVIFQTYFHQLVEPLADSSLLGSTPSSSQQYWDRSVPAVSPVVIYPRRAYYARFLILSAGPDGKSGTPYLTDRRFSNGTPMFTDAALKTAAASQTASTMAMLMFEGQAAQATLTRTGSPFFAPSGITGSTGDLYTNQLQVDGLDDITNHNLSTSAVSPQ